MRRAVRLSVLVAALPLIACCKGEGRGSEAFSKSEVICKAEDGVETRGILYSTNKPRPPAIVLVHALGASPESWAPFAQRAQEEGFICLALTLRGDDVPDQAAAMNVLKDIDAAMGVLREHGAAPDNMAVVGASLGANIALHYAVAHHEVQATVMVSPGLDFKGVKTESAIVELGRRPVLLVTTKGDAYSASSCAKLKSEASGFCELREYEGSAHGADIFASSPNSIEQILLWLEGIVGEHKHA